MTDPAEPIDLEAIKRVHAMACNHHSLRGTEAHDHRGQLIAEAERLRARVEELEPESDAWRRVYAALHDVRIGGLSAIESAEAVIKGTHEEVLALRRRVAELERELAEAYDKMEDMAMSAPPAERASAEPRPPYRVRAFWSPCQRYIVTACVSADDITLIDDNGEQWDPTGPEQDMTQPADQPEGER